MTNETGRRFDAYYFPGLADTGNNPQGGELDEQFRQSAARWLAELLCQRGC